MKIFFVIMLVGVCIAAALEIYAGFKQQKSIDAAIEIVSQHAIICIPLAKTFCVQNDYNKDYVYESCGGYLLAEKDRIYYCPGRKSGAPKGCDPNYCFDISSRGGGYDRNVHILTDIERRYMIFGYDYQGEGTSEMNLYEKR